MDTTTVAFAVATFVTSLFTFLTVVFQHWIAMKSAAQQHQWDKEDRAALAVTVAHTTEEIKSAIQTNTDLTHEAKEASLQAQQEANTVNRKLQQIGVDRVEILRAGLTELKDGSH